MFGLLIPGRAVQAQPHETISQTQYAFTIPPAPPFSHLAVFLLPGNALPADALAGIYIQIPGAGAGAQASAFRLLGALAPDKQSAVFRIGGSGTTAAAAAAAAAAAGADTAVREEIMLDDATGENVAAAAPAGENVVVGISIEPAPQIQAQLEALRAQAPREQGLGGGQLVRASGGDGGAPSAAMLKEAARKIGLNAYNFLTGFASGPAGSESVPLKSVQEWWSKFEKKVEMDVGFLMRDGA